MKMLVTGSSGLIGSETVAYFADLGWQVQGIDNNLRADFFGPDADTTPNLRRLAAAVPGYQHHDLDVRDRTAIDALVRRHRFNAIVHCAAQPSHDLAARRPFDDFDTNAVGTLNLLEATRRHAPDATFVFMSTNKVYGDAPNERPLIETPTRWDYAHPADRDGIDESCRIDASLHSLFGASKAAADLLVQEYGRYFSLKTICFRAGCMTGPYHAGVPLHGFLSYLVKVGLQAAGGEAQPYTIIGYKGKQVRDQIHAHDVCRAIHAFLNAPRIAAVYNLGGGRDNSLSVLESIARVEERLGVKLPTRYRNEPRRGDHICYISNLARFRRDYPGWRITRTLDDILDEMIAAAPAAVA